MTSKKPTPEVDFKRFESFLDAMSDIEYEFWYKNEATIKQRDLADGIREELDDDDADALIAKHRDSLRNFYHRWI